MNECTHFVLLYNLLVFSDFVPDSFVRYQVGWAYIGVTLANIAMHLTIMLATSLQRLRLLYRRRINLVKARKAATIKRALVQAATQPSLLM